MNKRLTGLIVATFTPMHADGTLNLDAVPAMVEFLLRQEIGGLYVVGSTGESISLTSQERRNTAEAFVRAVAGRAPIVVQVGHNSLSEARDLAAHAEQIGAAAVSASPPTYFAIDSAKTLAASMAEVARGAPSTPFYYYHVPHFTGAAFDMFDFLQVAADRIPTLAGIKYTAPTLYDLQACLEFDDRRFDILNGFDHMLLASLAIGVRGAVGSTYNFAAPVYHRIINAFSRGDLETARLWQVRSIDMIRVVLRRGSLAGQKAMMKLIGFDCGPTRLPVASVTEADLPLLREELAAIGYFDWSVSQEPSDR